MRIVDSLSTMILLIVCGFVLGFIAFGSVSGRIDVRAVERGLVLLDGRYYRIVPLELKR